ncbi:MAG: C-3',4' desaturase CrtD [Gloeomargaritaceae cyanobacterium C42_A2020_066]|nr:C-3',4' desaturase CrtD [Gloeomargaritaceae cyanobacterium C42_A2020_066]
MSQAVVVIGGGIGGLTAGALLARRGYSVTVLEQAAVPGGCASTFRRGGFIFDVGATQVAGLEPGGIHHQIFSELEEPLPVAVPCDPACAVLLPGETEAIAVWRDPQRWQTERQRQFPTSSRFWACLDTLFQASWRFQARQPILPPRSLWDVGQLLQAVRPDTLVTLPFTFWTVTDLLRILDLERDHRLRQFLDLQLKLYSQCGADETALLYAATALSVSQAPRGLFHLQGSMQALSQHLVAALHRYGGKLRRRHRVTRIQVTAGRVRGVWVETPRRGSFEIPADHVVANVPVQNLVSLLGEQAPAAYTQRVAKLPPASGAFVVYLGVDQRAIPVNCPPHLQFLYDPHGPIAEVNSLFVSVSQPGDGRAPAGRATITASSFTDPELWWGTADYTQLKENYTRLALTRLAQYFDLQPSWVHVLEAATPRTFARYTARQQGIVGGIGQRVATFGPFGVATRTPIPHLWLVGDSTHPGEGTAGVSYSAWSAVRQITAGT